MKITVDFNKEVNKIKPMHAVGQPPFIGMNFDYFQYLTDAHVPYSRLHDVGGAYGRGVFVDIPNLFRDFSKDPYDENNYDFVFTDELIKALVKYNIEPFFRLGVTIENYCTLKAYRIDPPSDFKKWAVICEHIIRHYTEGWANGFNFKIKYWEIWNEPDNYEDPKINQMWTGTPEEYYELYEVTSKHLKEKFPHLSIGGYASCGFYALTASKNEFGKSTPRLDYFIDFFEGFMKYISARKCPMDFFSWHSYSSIEDNVIWADYARKKLDEYGYTECEHTLNEWNCRPDLKGTMHHAALSAGMMLALQNTSLDSAMFYDAKMGIGNYAGLFNAMTYKPLPTYYAIKAFGEQYVRGTQVEITGLEDKIYAVAAKGEDKCVLIANTNEIEKTVDISFISGEKIKSAQILTETGFADFEFTGTLPADAVVIINC